MDEPLRMIVQANLKSTEGIGLGQAISLRRVELHPKFKLNRKIVLRQAAALAPVQTISFQNVGQMASGGAEGVTARLDSGQRVTFLPKNCAEIRAQQQSVPSGTRLPPTRLTWRGRSTCNHSQQLIASYYALWILRAVRSRLGH
jgi:hypothetical protein